MAGSGIIFPLFLIPRQKSLVITTLVAGHAYELRVTAGNLYGFGLPSDPVPAALDEEKITRAKAAELESMSRGKKIKVDDYDKFCELNMSIRLSNCWWLYIVCEIVCRQRYLEPR